MPLSDSDTDTDSEPEVEVEQDIDPEEAAQEAADLAAIQNAKTEEAKIAAETRRTERIKRKKEKKRVEAEKKKVAQRKRRKQEQEKRQRAALIHKGVECGTCHINPIIGDRWHLPGFKDDLCDACYQELPAPQRRSYTRMRHTEETFAAKTDSTAQKNSTDRKNSTGRPNTREGTQEGGRPNTRGGTSKGGRDTPDNQYSKA
jgi:hypothetical protein